MSKIETWQLKQRQGLPLNLKVELTKNRIREFYKINQGMVYVAFSGGKDSTVLLHLVRNLFPEVEGVFSDTGLEYPEIKEFVKTTSNITTIRPKKSFIQVLKEYGYPVVSKNVARYVRDLQNPTKKNKRTRDIRLGKTNSKVGTLSKKWRYLVNAPFKCSERCCDVMKKLPFKRYETKSKKHPIIGTMVTESRQRKLNYLRTGCINHTKNMAMPLSFWTEKDIWNYIKKYNLKYSKIYDMGEKRTGCIFCMFGVHLEKEPNRFQRMAKTHPQLYNYCMNQLGLKEILIYLNVKYKPAKEIQCKLLENSKEDGIPPANKNV